MGLRAGFEPRWARSLELLIDLDSLMHEYLDSEPVDLQRQIQPDGLTSVFALLVTTEPPLDLALRVGEVVHQIRSALDHLANRLVRAAGHQPTRRTSFPNHIRPPRKAVAIHPGVDPKALSVIDQVQPYHRRHEPDHHPLAVLNELWNIDKHRNLSLTATLLANSQIYISDAKGGWRVGGQFQPGPLAEDGIVGVFRFEGGGPSADAEVEASGDLFVTIADTGFHRADHAIASMGNRALEGYNRIIYLIARSTLRVRPPEIGSDPLPGQPTRRGIPQRSGAPGSHADLQDCERRRCGTAGS